MRVATNLRAAVVLAGICSLAIACAGQSVSTNPGATSGFGGDPEDAYLSATRYTNVYFGFSFEFPESAGLKPVPQPASLDRRIQLLELSGVPYPHSAITISAYEYKNKNYTDAKGILRKELDQELFSGVEQLHGIGKTTCGSQTFYYFETRKGPDQHTELAAEMNGYVVDVDLRARDVNLLHALLTAFQHAEFFTPQEAAKHAGPNAATYQGPAISAQHLREVRESEPAEHMDPGKIESGVYRNAQIGVTYQFPQGWNVEPDGAIEPSVEHYREKVLGEPSLGPRERAVVKACRRTLLSAWRTKPDTQGEVSYEDFGEVTLTAMPLSCFPNIRFPEDVRDAVAVRQFVAGLSFTQPLQRDMTEAKTFEADGKPFVLTHGTIAYKEEGDALTKRVSVSMAMTQQRGYLLIWLFAAPHDAELRELMVARAAFAPDADSAKVAPLASIKGGGSGEGAGPATQAMPAPANASEDPKNSEAPKNNVNGDSAAPQSYPRPSLLRDGEAAETAQKARQTSSTPPK